MPKKYSPLAFLASFRARIAVAGANECWNWQGAFYKNGYGKVHLKRRAVGAHRVTYFLSLGLDVPYDRRLTPTSPVVRHTCDNKRCCNPKHLELGTQQDNMTDCRQKKRDHKRCGSTHPKAKLKEAEVPEIRNLRAGGITYREIAETYRVSEGTIKQVIQGITWSQVP